MRKIFNLKKLIFQSARELAKYSEVTVANEFDYDFTLNVMSFVHSLCLDFAYIYEDVRTTLAHSTPHVSQSLVSGSSIKILSQIESHIHFQDLAMKQTHIISAISFIALLARILLVFKPLCTRSSISSR